MTERHVFLMGFMGAGKSTIGELLARSLNRPFQDLDESIVDSEGDSIASIFERHGEKYFRRLESRVLQEIIQSSPKVVALGGGTFLNSENRRRIQASGICIWLQVSLEEARRRCQLGEGRPLARDPHLFEKLYAERQPVYGLSELRVMTDGKSTDAVVQEILRLLQN